MSMSRSQIRSKARKHANLTSANTGGYSDNDLNAMIDESILEIASVTHSRTASTFSASDDFDTVSGTRLYDFPTKLLKIYALYYKGEALKFTKIEDLQRGDTFNWFQRTGRPEQWYMEEAQIGLYPIPNDAQAVKCFGIRKPDALSDDTDTPDIDEKLHPAIEWYVAREIWLDREDPNDMAEKCGQRYNDKVTQYLELQGNPVLERTDALMPDIGV